MSREVSDDLRALITFAQNYNLSKTSTQQSFIKLLSSQHKRYFAVLTVLSEMKHQGVRPVRNTVAEHEAMNRAFLDHTTESVSDLGSSLFVWIHGAYKASRQVVLRTT
jgi:aspartyl aminopeptidase